MESTIKTTTTDNADRTARHSSTTTEHFTPSDVVEFARAVMGGIDLDPASCPLANTVVGADQIYAVEDNGFPRPWHGRVFLNPPGGRCDATGRPLQRGCTQNGSCGLPAPHAHPGATSSSKAWWRRLVEEYQSGRVSMAFFVGFSMEILQTAQVGNPTLVSPLHFPICIPRQRLQFLRASEGRMEPGTSPTHANVLVLLPPKDTGENMISTVRRFVELGADFGMTGWLQRQL
jgi:hypothetical protein